MPDAENDATLTDAEIGLLRTSRGLDHVPTEGLDAVIAELAPTVEHIIAGRRVVVCDDCEWEFPNRAQYEAHLSDPSFIHTRPIPPATTEGGDA